MRRIRASRICTAGAEGASVPRLGLSNKVDNVRRLQPKSVAVVEAAGHELMRVVDVVEDALIGELRLARLDHLRGLSAGPVRAAADS